MELIKSLNAQECENLIGGARIEKNPRGTFMETALFVEGKTSMIYSVAIDAMRQIREVRSYSAEQKIKDMNSIYKQSESEVMRLYISGQERKIAPRLIEKLRVAKNHALSSLSTCVAQEVSNDIRRIFDNGKVELDRMSKGSKLETGSSIGKMSKEINVLFQFGISCAKDLPDVREGLKDFVNTSTSLFSKYFEEIEPEFRPIFGINAPDSAPKIIVGAAEGI